MSKIKVLDQLTIDKIAAGEVVERPASVVKELVENAIDSGATAIVVEIKDGGISFIRITDNGCGIAPDEVPHAFLRHATSKIRSADDLSGISSLGFRGEALSSISAVSMMELITKEQDADYGVTYRIEGGKEIALDVTGAPNGSTFFVRQLFYNTPARRKFLKTPMTEASHVSDLVTRLALSHPEISFQFINNGQSKIHTSGNGNLKDVIYHIYGREIASHLIPVERVYGAFKLTGFIGEPVVSRGNRNFENYFINQRYVKNNIISKSIEDAYKDFTMQHRYPFTVLHLTVNPELVDVNVHPSKMEVRFSNQQELYGFLCDTISACLHHKEDIPQIEIPEVTVPKTTAPAMREMYQVKGSSESPTVRPSVSSAPERPAKPAGSSYHSGPRDLNYFMDRMRERVTQYHAQKPEPAPPAVPPAALPKEETKEKVPEQLSLFDEKLIDPNSVKEHRIIGQIFDTYLLIEFKNSLYIIDQHAAHERVLYEKTMRGMKTREYTSQNISPPIILELSMLEAQMLETYRDRFERIGFVIEKFGPDSYVVSAVPDNLFSVAKKDLLYDMIDSLCDEVKTDLAPDLIDEKIASMSCKAAVKGNMHLSMAEADALIGELLSLENPYHCPHGRPTIIAMTKKELDKKFKRIV